MVLLQALVKLTELFSFSNIKDLGWHENEVINWQPGNNRLEIKHQSCEFWSKIKIGSRGKIPLSLCERPQYQFMGRRGRAGSELHKELCLMIPQIMPTACVLLKVCHESWQLAYIFSSTWFLLIWPGLPPWQMNCLKYVIVM